MKKTLILLSILTSFVASAQSIEINPNAANSSAVLDLKSTTKGFLPPRMTGAQMRAIPSPAQGLLAFCTDCGTNGDYYFYKGSAWVALGSVTVSVSTTMGSVSANADEKGATITNGVLNLAPADATKPGIITATDQTFGGVKTFSNGIVGNVTGNADAATKITSITNADIVQLTSTQTLTNKTLTSPTITGTGAIAGTFTGNLTGNVTGNASTATTATTATNLSGGAAGSIPYQTATGTTSLLAAGSSGQVLTSSGLGTLTWATASSGIPYTGATAAVNLGAYDLTVNGLTVGKGAGGISTNTAVGLSALSSNTTGFANTANGVDALSSNTTGSQNTAIGEGALHRNTTGSENTANGEYALFNNTTGILNTANGFGALFNNNTGSKNTAYGLSALTSNITGSNNTAIGYNANVTSYNLENATAIGNGAIVSASNKIQLGNGDVTDVQLGTGINVTLNGITVGKGAGGISTNTAIGVSALSSNTDGYSNTANGYNALYANTTGYGNTANGTDALYVNTTGYYNTATGGGALNFNTTGYENTATGVGALILNTTGTKNTAIGLNALKNNTTGSNNTAIGYNADVSSSDLTNATAIGNGATVGASHKVRIGNASVTVIEGQVAWSNVSDRRLKENIQVNNYLGLNFINKLQPVTYNYISDNTKVMHDGFIAQDIEQVMKDLNMPFSGLKKSSDGMYSLAYSDFVMPMVNAIKEQKTIIDNQQKQIDELKKMVESLLKK